MFTRVFDDACSVNNRDGRNEEQYLWNMSQLPNFRRDEPNDQQMQIFRNQGRGLEQNIAVENRLFRLNQTNNSCNSFEAGIQQELVDSTPQYDLRCLGNDLKPTYTKMSRIANNSATYMNPNKPQPGWYFYYTPPMPLPGVGLYAFDRKSINTQLAAKDANRAPNRDAQYFGRPGRKNPHAVPRITGCSHFGLFN